MELLKKNKLYEIFFIGKSGVDTGKLSQEFYSGKLFYALHFLADAVVVF